MAGLRPDGLAVIGREFDTRNLDWFEKTRCPPKVVTHHGINDPLVQIAGQDWCDAAICTTYTASSPGSFFDEGGQNACWH
jgi:hypothetical protein